MTKKSESKSKPESKSNPPTKAKLNKLGKKSQQKKPKEFVEEVKSETAIWIEQRNRALVVLGIKDHLLDTACDIADKATLRKDKTALYMEFIDVLSLVPKDMRDQVIKDISEALDDSPKPKPETKENDNGTN